jgi:hypothetical protein
MPDLVWPDYGSLVTGAGWKCTSRLYVAICAALQTADAFLPAWHLARCYPCGERLLVSPSSSPAPDMRDALEAAELLP